MYDGYNLLICLPFTGFNIMIYTDAHEPPHVHVRRAGGIMKITLHDLKVIYVKDLTICDSRQAKQIVIEQREALLSKWMQIHRGDSDVEQS